MTDETKRAIEEGRAVLRRERMRSGRSCLAVVPGAGLRQLLEEALELLEAPKVFDQAWRKRQREWAKRARRALR